MEGKRGEKRYCNPFTGTAHFDSDRGMYYMEIPTEMKRWYSENIGNFYQYKMKSASGSPVEYDGRILGTVSGLGYNDSHFQIVAGFKPFEARFYIAPARSDSI